MIKNIHDWFYESLIRRIFIQINLEINSVQIKTFCFNILSRIKLRFIVTPVHLIKDKLIRVLFLQILELVGLNKKNLMIFFSFFFEKGKEKVNCI